jgi:hypothetical protein
MSALHADMVILMGLHQSYYGNARALTTAAHAPATTIVTRHWYGQLEREK